MPITPIAQLMATPIANDADASTRFATLERMLREMGDRRAPFATLYSMTTNNVIAAIAAGQFSDGAWVGTYLNTFAELYREAFFDFETGDAADVSGSWAIAFSTAATKKELVLQDLSLGVNAHVLGDLAHALVAVGIGSLSDPTLRARRYADHCAVNNVLHAELVAAMTKIANDYAPGLNMLPSELLSIFESAFFTLLVTGRQSAWNHAVALTDGDVVTVELAKGEILVESVGVAKAILAPMLSPELMAALHRVEES